MNSIELQKYIIDNDLIPVVLKDLGCKGIKDYGKEYRSSRPDGDNTSALSVNKETLRVYCYTENWGGNLYTLCMKTLFLSFGQAQKYLHALLGLKFKFDFSETKKKTPNALDIFTKYRCRDLNCEDEQYTQDLESINFEPYLHINWIKEGITNYTREVFNIQYDGMRRKIIIPHRDWNTGKTVGIMSRTTISAYEALGIPKYYPIVPYQKGNNLYGLYENYQSIIENGYVVVYEAEKSVLKRHSLHDETGVAVCTHSITNKQAEILISLNVDIIIAWDKDIGDEDIFKACNKFKGIRNVYYIKDTEGILGEKDSPADASNENFIKLFNKKIKYA